QDCLAQKIQRLATGRPEPGQRPVREEQYIKTPPDELPARQEQAVQMRKEEMPPVAGTTPEPEAAEAPPSYAPSVPAAPVDGQQVEAARRFARIILSDIALYNQGAVEEGIRGGNFEEVLSAELREGRDLYNNRVPEEVRRTMDYYADEIRKFIDKKKQTMQLG
ncbi:MAG TPA: hypothetical protein VJM83_03325, partial [Nitrospirota bacterium]|nr:hypothetical protein [Nitrospirota bacterium]